MSENVESVAVRIASHHKNDPWRPEKEWNSEVWVQWGRHGIVLSDNSYKTAFFEVFPDDNLKSGGFIRGEGKTLEDAEASAFLQWIKYSECGNQGHQWSRNRTRSAKKIQPYLNGGCFCTRCGAFTTAMAPIVKIGSYLDPLTTSDLQFIGMGMLRSLDKDKVNDEDRFKYKIVLKAKLAGILLPESKEVEPNTNPFKDDDYSVACRKCIQDFLVKNPDYLSRENGGLFGEIAKNYVARVLKEEF